MSVYVDDMRMEAAHYDVTDSLRGRAIRLGAVPETMEEGSARRRRAAVLRDAASRPDGE